MSSSVRFMVVGTGWRARFFLRLAPKLEEVDLAGVVVHQSCTPAEAEALWQAPAYSSLEEGLRHQKPDFVVISVPRTVAPDLTKTVVNNDIRVLLETPPATGVDEMRRLWDDVGMTGLVQVAEQYPLYPGHLGPPGFGARRGHRPDDVGPGVVDAWLPRRGSHPEIS